MSDLISRQAAISAICNACGKIDCDKMDECEKLQLPPANCSEIPNGSDDTISRQAAIDAIHCNIVITGRENAELVAKTIGEFADRIKALPSAQTEPHEGHWILRESPDGGEQYECSECGVLWELNDGTPEDNEAYFCPKCGADMRGGKDENR